MALLQFAPDRLSWLEKEEGYVADNGDWYDGAEVWQGDEDCTIVQNNGQANIINLGDGNSVNYSHTIYCNNKIRDFKYGDMVRVTMQNGETRTFKVLGFTRKQLQVKIFV